MHLLSDHLATCVTVKREADVPEEPSPTIISISPEHSPPLSPPSGPPFSPLSLSGSPVPAELQEIEDALVRSVVENSSNAEQETNPQSLAECIQRLQQLNGIKLPKEEIEWYEIPRMEVDIRRSHVLGDALREGHKKKFNPKKVLKVSFVGEPAVDTGGPSREFWRLLLHAVQDNLCHGEENQKVFVHNVPALQNLDFRVVGKWIGMSIIHGGPGFPVLSPHIYKYISTQQYTDLCIEDKDVPDPAVRTLLMKINSAKTEGDLRSLFADEELSSLVFETGYRTALPCLKLADRPTLCRVLRDYHALIKVLPEIDQFTEGLGDVGVLKYICDFPELMRPLFVTDFKKRIDKAFLKEFLQPEFRPTNDPLRCKEEKAFVYFMDFVEECEDGEIVTVDGNHVVTPEDCLVFFTGADREPPLGFSRKAKLIFNSGVLATASTCDFTLYLPYCHDTYETFKAFMIESFVSHGGFGQA